MSERAVCVEIGYHNEEVETIEGNNTGKDALLAGADTDILFPNVSSCLAVLTVFQDKSVLASHFVMTYTEFDGVPYEDWNAPKDTVKRMLALLEDSGKTIKHLYCLCSRDGQSDWSVTVDKLKALIGTADKTTFAQNNAYVTMDVVVKISGTDVRIFMKNHEAHPIKPSFSVGSLGASYTCT